MDTSSATSIVGGGKSELLEGNIKTVQMSLVQLFFCKNNALCCWGNFTTTTTTTTAAAAAAAV